MRGAPQNKLISRYNNNNNTKQHNNLKLFFLKCLIDESNISIVVLKFSLLSSPHARQDLNHKTGKYHTECINQTNFRQEFYTI